MFAEYMDTNNIEQIQEFMEESIKGDSNKLPSVIYMQNQ